jgi:hypothetical protein
MLPDVSPALPVIPRAVFLRVSQPPLMPPLRRAPRMLPAFPSYLATPPSATAYTYAEFVLWVARQTVRRVGLEGALYGEGTMAMRILLLFSCLAMRARAEPRCRGNPQRPRLRTLTLGG